MSIQNLLVLKNYNIKTTAKNNLIHLSAKSSYDEMQKLVIESALQFIPNLDDIIVDSKDVETSQDMFKDHMIECYNHWSERKANILYCDLDVIFVKSCNVFSLGIEDFFMPGAWTCGVRYYPSTMSQYLWKIMFKEHRLWDTRSCGWNHEQDIYKKMEHAAGGLVDHDWQPQIIKTTVDSVSRISTVPGFIVRESPVNEILDPPHLLQTLRESQIMPHALHLHSTRDPIMCSQYMCSIRKLTE